VKRGGLAFWSLVILALQVAGRLTRVPRGSGGLVEIVEGVQPDEVVATSGLTKLGNGVAVTVREAGAGSADPST